MTRVATRFHFVTTSFKLAPTPSLGFVFGPLSLSLSYHWLVVINDKPKTNVFLFIAFRFSLSSSTLTWSRQPILLAMLKLSHIFWTPRHIKMPGDESRRTSMRQRSREL